jgi:hypothetical protein
MPASDVKDFCHSPCTSHEGYRFTGYNLPTIKLGDGFPYYFVGVHPSILRQPTFFQKPAFSVGFNTVGGHIAPIFSPRAPLGNPKTSPILPI